MPRLFQAPILADRRRSSYSREDAA